MANGFLPQCVFAAGLGQIALAAASLAIPRVLKWGDELAPLKPFYRRLFWTYSVYIWGTNVALGLVSALAPAALLDGSLLAGAVCGYALAYWGGRLIVQFAVFDFSELPQGRGVRAARRVLDAGFVALVIVYAVALGANLRGGLAPSG